MLSVRIPAIFEYAKEEKLHGKTGLYYHVKVRGSREDSWLPYVAIPEDISSMEDNPNLAFKLQRRK